MSGYLYQLRQPTRPVRGQLFIINGPWDTWGRVVKDLDDYDRTKGGYLALIRGFGKCKPPKF